MNFFNFKKVKCLGVGGGAVSYAAKFFGHLGSFVSGHDIKETSVTKELAHQGIEIILENPSEAFEQDVDLVIFSAGLPKKVIENARQLNRNIKMWEVGDFTDTLIHCYENDKLSVKELDAFEKSNIAPLFTFDYASQKFIAVTGTDGKTTTSFMLYHILKELEYKPAMITTVGARIGDKVMDTGLHTTSPSAHTLHELLMQAKEAKCTHVILETTSHGLSMGRLAGVKLDVAVYTNIKRDHLDYHKTWNNYLKAKAQLITRHLKNGGHVILNYDDSRAFGELNALANNTIIYTTKKSEHSFLLGASKIRETAQGLSYSLRGSDYVLPLYGRYNIENALAALGACSALAIDTRSAALALESFESVPGRMQVLQKKPFHVIVDFAHTPNGLRSALKAARKMSSNRVTAVFGCAGRRDPPKRHLMGKVAKRYADISILTAEDPRDEDLKVINDQIVSGWEAASAKERKLYRFDDTSKNVKVRRDAIKKALKIAEPGDVVILCGKGHEQSLCFGNTEYPWNDVKETKKLL